MVSLGGSSPASGGPFAPAKVVRGIGRRSPPLYVVRYPAGGSGAVPLFAVAQRFEGAACDGDSVGEQALREAQRIATLACPNLARVKEVTTYRDDMVVVTELVEGDKLHDLWRAGTLPLEIALRLIVDVLAGATAMHNVRDSKQQPLKLAHGEISPATVVLGLDGVARLLHAVARRVPPAAPEAASLGYLAPEVLSDEPYDGRADVFSAGVLLWEALSGECLFPEKTAADIVREARSGPLPVPEKAPWAKGLVGVAVKALAADPDERWPTAAALAAEIRKACGLKLAPASAAAAFARTAVGPRVKARRQSLERWVTHELVGDKGRSDRSLEPRPAARPLVAAPTTVLARPPTVETPPEPVLSEEGRGHERIQLEVVELESTLLEPAPETIPAPATSSAVGGLVLDPFAAGAMPSPRARPALPGLIDETEPVPEREPHNRSARPRKLLVLGGVALLAAAVFVLAAVRVVGQDGAAPAASTRPSVANIEAAAPALPDAPAASPPMPAAGAPPTTPTPVQSRPTPAQQAPAVVTPTRTTAPAAAPAPKPRPKPTFDPNSL